MTFIPINHASAVVLGRFLPIVRTFAPFVAGMSAMPGSAFAYFNVLGAALWTCLCCGAWEGGDLGIAYAAFLIKWWPCGRGLAWSKLPHAPLSPPLACEEVLSTKSSTHPGLSPLAQTTCIKTPIPQVGGTSLETCPLCGTTSPWSCWRSWCFPSSLLRMRC